MLKIFHEKKFKDGAILMGIVACLIIAIIGLCIGAVEMSIPELNLKTITSFSGITKGDPSFTPIGQAALAFAIIGFFAFIGVVALVVLEYFEIVPQVTKYKMFVSLATVVFLLISISCVGGYVAKINDLNAGFGDRASVSAGPVLLFLFGFLGSVAAIFFNRGLKFWQDPNKIETKKQSEPTEEKTEE